MLIFTNLGNVIYRPIHELTDIRWKDIGEHLSQTITNFATDEYVLYAEIVDDFGSQTYLLQQNLDKSNALNARNSHLGALTNQNQLNMLS